MIATLSPIIITVLIGLFIAFIFFSVGDSSNPSHFSEKRTLKAKLKLKELENRHAYNLASLKSSQELKHRQLENQKEIKLAEIESNINRLKEHNIELAKELGKILMNEENVEFPPIKNEI